MQILSYNPGGHYAPHFDYIPFTNEEEKEKSEMDEKYGNRFLTFLFILQTAKKGGGKLSKKHLVYESQMFHQITFYMSILDCNSSLPSSQL